MENTSFMKVDEVAQELGVSKSYAYKIVQKLNEMTGGRADEFLPSAEPIPIRHDYPTNANGETYGSYLDILKYGYPPQLIRAIGDNNQTGYLRLADFRADNRPSNANAVWNIYDLNGTVIDTFGK